MQGSSRKGALLLDRCFRLTKRTVKEAARRVLVTAPRCAAHARDGNHDLDVSDAAVSRVMAFAASSVSDHDDTRMPLARLVAGPCTALIAGMSGSKALAFRGRPWGCWPSISSLRRGWTRCEPNWQKRPRSARLRSAVPTCSRLLLAAFTILIIRFRRCVAEWWSRQL